MNGLGDPCDIVSKMQSNLTRLLQTQILRVLCMHYYTQYSWLVQEKYCMSPGKHWPQRVPHRLDEHCASGSSNEICLNPLMQYSKGHLELNKIIESFCILSEELFSLSDIPLVPIQTSLLIWNVSLSIWQVIPNWWSWGMQSHLGDVSCRMANPTGQEKRWAKKFIGWAAL